VLTQTEILTQLIFPNQGVSWHNLLVFLIFMLLFLAIDMLAVVLKMARVGVYEAKVDMAEGHNKLLEFIDQRHQTVTQFSELASKEQSTIEHLNVNLLKQDLDENFKNLIRSFAQSDRQKLDNFFKD
jgi:chemotaxis methyl-accepting protein methylase